MPVPGKWHQWAHSLLEGRAGTPNPLLELMALKQGKAEVWWEESLAWGRHLPRNSGPAAPLCRRALSLLPS